MRNMLPWKRNGGAGSACELPTGTRLAHDPLEAFFTDADRWFAQGWPTPAAARVSPRMDVIDAGHEYRVTLELPGVDEKDVELSIDGSTLIVKGEKHATARAENEGVLHADRTHGAFQRALELPVEIDANAVQARLEHGLLVISLPKSEKAKPRKIEVKRG